MYILHILHIMHIIYIMYIIYIHISDGALGGLYNEQCEISNSPFVKCCACPLRVSTLPVWMLAADCGMQGQGSAVGMIDCIVLVIHE